MIDDWIKNDSKVFVFLHLLLGIYSFTGVLGKKAAMYPFLSMGFVVFYFGLIMVLVIYAIFWQQIIKRLPLSVAFANKAVMVIWGMIWGKIFFDETISTRQIIGALVVIIGIILFANSDS